jgi:hypothetical protein
MGYTTVRVSAAGVVLFEDHAVRLGPEARPAFEQFAATATEGVYSLRAHGAELTIERRAGSRLHDEVVLRTRVSPMLSHPGPFAKPAPPSLYDSVRIPDAITLLTNHSGDELYECDVASVMAWDGASLVLVPTDRPRVLSVAEAFVAREFLHRRAAIRTDGDWGLLLMNAVAAVAPKRLHGRHAFPPELLADLRAAMELTATR